MSSGHTLNPGANKHSVHVCSGHVWGNTEPILPVPLSVCHTCDAKDRSDYEKAVLWTLPVQGEAEVVTFFHAAVDRRQHDFLHARWCKLCYAITYVPFASPNVETGLMPIKLFLHEGGNGRMLETESYYVLRYHHSCMRRSRSEDNQQWVAGQ